MNLYEGLETYKTYIAVRNHFKQDSYDYFKYRGKSKVNGDSFLKRKDKFFFAKLERRLSKQEVLYFFVANFVHDDSNWSGSLVTEQSMTIFNEWKKRIQSLSYLFKDECDNLKQIVDLSGKEFDNLFLGNGTHPALLKLYMQKQVSLETMVIMDKVLGYIARWNKQFEGDVVYDNVGRLIAKYSCFVDIDVSKYKTIMKQTFIQ